MESFAHENLSQVYELYTVIHTYFYASAQIIYQILVILCLDVHTETKFIISSWE